MCRNFILTHFLSNLLQYYLIVFIFQDILRVWYIHPEPGTFTASATSTAGAPVTLVPSTTTVHSDQRAIGHPNSRHCIRVEGVEAHIRCQDRLHYPLLHESRTNRAHHLRYYHRAGATDGSGLSRLLSAASALPGFSLRWLDFNLTIEPFAIQSDHDRLPSKDSPF